MTATGSVCLGPAAGTRSSTPTPTSTVDRVSAISAAWRRLNAILPTVFPLRRYFASRRSRPSGYGRRAKPLSSMEVWPGQRYPLGATFDGAGTNFALFSEVATQVEL